MTNRKIFWALPIAAIAGAVYVLSTSSPDAPILIEPIQQAVAMPPEEAPPMLEPEPEPAPEPVKQNRTKKNRDMKSRGKNAVGPNAQFVMAEDEPRPQLSDGQFYAALEDWRGVRTCLAEATPGRASDSGAIRLRFKIAPNGEVKRTVAYDTEGPHAARIRGCVERYALGVKFPSFPGNEEIEKDATFVF